MSTCDHCAVTIMRVKESFTGSQTPFEIRSLTTFRNVSSVRLTKDLTAGISCFVSSDLKELLRHYYISFCTRHELVLMFAYLHCLL